MTLTIEQLKIAGRFGLLNRNTPCSGSNCSLSKKFNENDVRALTNYITGGPSAGNIINIFTKLLELSESANKIGAFSSKYSRAHRAYLQTQIALLQSIKAKKD